MKDGSWLVFPKYKKTYQRCIARKINLTKTQYGKRLHESSYFFHPRMSQNCYFYRPHPPAPSHGVFLSFEVSCKEEVLSVLQCLFSTYWSPEETIAHHGCCPPKGNIKRYFLLTSHKRVGWMGAVKVVILRHRWMEKVGTFRHFEKKYSAGDEVVNLKH